LSSCAVLQVRDGYPGIIVKLQLKKTTFIQDEPTGASELVMNTSKNLFIIDGTTTVDYYVDFQVISAAK